MPNAFTEPQDSSVEVKGKEIDRCDSGDRSEEPDVRPDGDSRSDSKSEVNVACRRFRGTYSFASGCGAPLARFRDIGAWRHKVGVDEVRVMERIVSVRVQSVVGRRADVKD